MKVGTFLCPSPPPRITNRSGSGFKDNYPSSDPNLQRVCYPPSASPPPVIRLSERRPASFVVPYFASSPSLASFSPPKVATASVVVSSPSEAATIVAASPDVRKRSFQEAEDRVACFIARNQQEDARRQAQLTARSRDPVAATQSPFGSLRLRPLGEHPLRSVETGKLATPTRGMSLEKFRLLQQSRREQADQHAVNSPL